ncbi:MAG: hypothetical protein A2087_12190 [Spirochaetes bacterium GWD1_61_31]|nr:MAG: hypothetical protein A2Y37_04825 [Spirochaetes bacterium GWB1_60_80]OHD30239.1 MAG: hypothetical protein A2004_11550 [Spirochaetes bacterium GWC1_61_12]OHD39825.1 MAG: hypothetical protein A2087_12190 [Spirochaetes bacterium GWD1_61_31]OHD44760.1 MAG: hypothetical protein A2Y35_03190 [Spirochaetes bacterium GWE1_60_18]OHD59933.1 MAG: hypothetical protein A2Y32_14040 [Spirochaetes bacterium GWF1_60_12]HAW85256.1 hypothetical protein [Spirochaetaceae bacterium]
MKQKHSQNRWLLFLLTSLTLALVSCAKATPPTPVWLELPALDWVNLEGLLVDHPLPAGFERSLEPTKLRVSFSTRLENQPDDDGLANYPGLISGRWLAVALPYNHDSIGLTLPQALARAHLPLNQISSPLRAAPVDGLLPGETGYPLTELLVAQLSGSQDPALLDWLTKLTPRPTRPQLIGAVGDIVIRGEGEPSLARADGDPAALLGDVLPHLRSRDLLLGNLETTVSTGGEPNLIKRFRFRIHPDSLAALVAAGFDFFSSANNHTHDYGPVAFTDTLRHLAASGVAWAGAGHNLAEASQPAILPVEASRLAVFGFALFPTESRGYKPGDAAATDTTPGILIDPELLRRQIAAARADGLIPVVFSHAGHEYVNQPPAWLKTMYRSFIEAGAALVLGSHPHVLQGVESWQDGIIVYSMGNFLFIGCDEDPPAQKSAIYSLCFYEGQFRGYNVLPVKAGDAVTSLDPGRDLAEFVALNRLIGN